MMGDTVLHVGPPEDGYDAHVGEGLLDRVGALVGGATAARRCALVSDDIVGGLYADRVLRSLDEQGFEVTDMRVASGERSKSWHEAGVLLERLAAGRFGRDSVVVALGGGVVGDLAGFVAGVFSRGVSVVHVPTTLLAQVDSSIGGKTGVDLPQGKNLAGVFWPPLTVIADVECLSTLTLAEWRSGMAEVAKAAILAGEDAFDDLVADTRALDARDGDATKRTVLMAAGLKTRVVSEDERESGVRESLNYGHTIGHAVERVAGYGALPHGVAVAEGIRFASLVAEEMIGADASWSSRQDELLTGLGLTRIPHPWPVDELVSAMHADKKVRGGVVRMVLTTGPGRWSIVPVEEQILVPLVHAWTGAQ